MKTNKTKSSEININDIEIDEIDKIDNIDESSESYENDNLSVQQIDKIRSDKINFNQIKKICNSKKNDNCIDEIDELIEASVKIALMCDHNNKESCISLYKERVTPKLGKVLSDKSNILPLNELSQLIKDLHDTISY